MTDDSRLAGSGLSGSERKQRLVDIQNRTNLARAKQGSKPSPLLDDLEFLVKEVWEVRRALAWYANKANYRYEDFESIPGFYEAPGVFLHDEGIKARAALGIEEETADA